MEDKKPVKGYKGFKAGLKCRDMSYEPGKKHVLDGNMILCKSGFHFCEKPIDVLRHYPYDFDNVYARVEASGKVMESWDKSVTDEITVGSELDIAKMFLEHAEFFPEDFCVVEEHEYLPMWVKEINGSEKKAFVSNDKHILSRGHAMHLLAHGSNKCAVATGPSSTAMVSGNESHALSTGEFGVAISDSVFNSRAISTGLHGMAVSTGHGEATATGRNGIAISQGNATSKGANSLSVCTGEHKVARSENASVAGGFKVMAIGKKISVSVGTECRAHGEGISAALGPSSKACGKMGCWIVLANWGISGKGEPIVKSFKIGDEVDGIKTKPDTYYGLTYEGKICEF